jgi:thiamine biosynthesis lipoprotein
MNPLTGLFNEQRKASSIISADPLEAEILSTVWMIANKEEQLLLTENFKNIQATIYDL